jgi:hypothetical protein
MKRWILFLGLFLLCFNFVNAADCSIQTLPCSSGNVVTGFYFSNSVNAHGASASASGYDYVLCCDPLNNVSSSLGTESAFVFSQTTNAQFGVPGSSSYPLSMKLANATCRATSSCFSDEYCLLSLATQTNSHASKCGTPGYNIDICCQSTLNVTLPTVHICGDGVVDTPNDAEVNEDCDGVVGVFLCTDFGWDGGMLDCNPAGSIDECLFNRSGCFSLGGTEPPVVGPNEYYVYGECLDDGDGDEYGEASWTIYSGNGSATSNGAIICQLVLEEVPFFGILSFLIFLIVISGYYINNYLRRFNNANCN